MWRGWEENVLSTHEELINITCLRFEGRAQSQDPAMASGLERLPVNFDLWQVRKTDPGHWMAASIYRHPLVLQSLLGEALMYFAILQTEFWIRFLTVSNDPFQRCVPQCTAFFICLQHTPAQHAVSTCQH